MSTSKFIGRCRACGKLVREEDSHVMIVAAEQGRIFFHSGCEPLKRTRDKANGGHEAERRKPPGDRDRQS